MQIGDWVISVENSDVGFPAWKLFVGIAVVLALMYGLGYLLIDVFGWIELTANQALSANIHPVRAFCGGLIVAPTVLAANAWFDR